MIMEDLTKKLPNYENTVAFKMSDCGKIDNQLVEIVLTLSHLNKNLLRKWNFTSVCREEPVKYTVLGYHRIP